MFSKPWIQRLQSFWIAITLLNVIGLVLYINHYVLEILKENINNTEIVEEMVPWSGKEAKMATTAITTTGNTKIVGFADGQYKNIASTWYRKLEQLGYTNHFVVTADDEAMTFFEKEGIRYDRLFHPDWTKNVTNFYSCAYHTVKRIPKKKRAQNYRRHLFASRWHYIVRQLQHEKFNILLTDVDNIFNRYLDMSELESSNYDVYHAFEGLVPSFPRDLFKQQGFTLCGGMSWWRSTPGVIEFVEQMTRRCRCDNETVVTCDCRCDDQQVLNSIILSPESEYKIRWDRQHVRIPETWDEQSWDSITGTCEKTSHKVKVWDRHTAYRGLIDPNRCPHNNWISMPSQIVDKASLPALWDAACGKGREGKTVASQPENEMIVGNSNKPWYLQQYEESDFSIRNFHATRNKTTKIIAFADSSSTDTLFQWYNQLQDLGYTSHVVVALDTIAAENLSTMGVRHEQIGPFSVPGNLGPFENCTTNPRDGPQKRRRIHRRRLYASRWNYILRQLANGTHVLITDAQSGLFMHRYMPMSEMELSNYDAFHAFSGGVPSYPKQYYFQFGFSICAGINWFRSTPGVIDFVKEVASLCKCAEDTLHCDCYCDDQQVLNRIIFEEDSAYKVLWDNFDASHSQSPIRHESNQSNQVWESFTGKCKKTGHVVKIWDRDTVFHGPLLTHHATGRPRCPQQNWIVSGSRTDQTLEQTCVDGQDLVARP